MQEHRRRPPGRQALLLRSSGTLLSVLGLVCHCSARAVCGTVRLADSITSCPVRHCSRGAVAHYFLCWASCATARHEQCAAEPARNSLPSRLFPPPLPRTRGPLSFPPPSIQGSDAVHTWTCLPFSLPDYFGLSFPKKMSKSSRASRRARSKIRRICPSNSSTLRFSLGRLIQQNWIACRISRSIRVGPNMLRPFKSLFVVQIEPAHHVASPFHFPPGRIPDDSCPYTNPKRKRGIASSQARDCERVALVCDGCQLACPAVFARHRQTPHSFATNHQTSTPLACTHNTAGQATSSTGAAG